MSTAQVEHRCDHLDFDMSGPVNGYHARCTCGWESTLFASEAIAANAFSEHVASASLSTPPSFDAIENLAGEIWTELQKNHKHDCTYAMTDYCDDCSALWLDARCAARIALTSSRREKTNA